MAHRTGCGTTTADSDMAPSLGRAVNLCQAEEDQAIPARARHLRGDGTQGAVVATVILETVRQHLNRDGAAPILPLQNCAGRRNTPVEERAAAAGESPLGVGGSEEA